MFELSANSEFEISGNFCRVYSGKGYAWGENQTISACAEGVEVYACWECGKAIALAPKSIAATIYRGRTAIADACDSTAYAKSKGGHAIAQGENSLAVAIVEYSIASAVHPSSMAEAVADKSIAESWYPGNAKALHTGAKVRNLETYWRK